MKDNRAVLDVVEKFTINIFYEWHQIWSGTQHVLSAKNADNFWTKAALVL